MSYRQELIVAAQAYHDDIEDKIEALKIESVNVLSLLKTYIFHKDDEDVRYIEDNIVKINTKLKRKQDKKTSILNEKLRSKGYIEKRGYVDNKEVFRKLRRGYRKLANKLARTSSEKVSTLDMKCPTTYFEMHRPLDKSSTLNENELHFNVVEDHLSKEKLILKKKEEYKINYNRIKEDFPDWKVSNNDIDNMSIKKIRDSYKKACQRIKDYKNALQEKKAIEEEFINASDNRFGIPVDMNLFKNDTSNHELKRYIDDIKRQIAVVTLYKEISKKINIIENLPNMGRISSKDVNSCILNIIYLLKRHAKDYDCNKLYWYLKSHHYDDKELLFISNQFTCSIEPLVDSTCFDTHPSKTSGQDLIELNSIKEDFIETSVNIFGIKVDFLLLESDKSCYYLREYINGIKNQISIVTVYKAAYMEMKTLRNLHLDSYNVTIKTKADKINEKYNISLATCIIDTLKKFAPGYDNSGCLSELTDGSIDFYQLDRIFTTMRENICLIYGANGLNFNHVNIYYYVSDDDDDDNFSHIETIEEQYEKSNNTKSGRKQKKNYTTGEKRQNKREKEEIPGLEPNDLHSMEFFKDETHSKRINDKNMTQKKEKNIDSKNKSQREKENSQIDRFISSFKTAYPSITFSRVSDNNDVMFTLLEKKSNCYIAMCIFLQIMNEVKTMNFDTVDDPVESAKLNDKIGSLIMAYTESKINYDIKQKTCDLKYIATEFEKRLYKFIGFKKDKFFYFP